MTGINLPSQRNSRPSKITPPADLYATALKHVPERYAIIQLGVSLFHRVQPEEDEEGELLVNDTHDGNNDATLPPQWRCRRYNFYTFPHAQSHRDVTLSPSAVAFLHQHDMSFDQWTRDGIPAGSSTTREMEAALRAYVQKQVTADQAAVTPPTAPTLQQASRRVELRRPEDIEFFSRCMASLREWLDSPAANTNNANNNNHHANHNANHMAEAAQPPQRQRRQQQHQPDDDDADPEGASFLLPPCNSFLRRAFYEAIGQEYPALILENAGSDYPNQIRVWRLDDEEKVRRDARLRRQAWQDMLVGGSVGLQRVFGALSLACRGLVPDRRSVLFAPSIDDIDWSLPPAAHLVQPQRPQIPLVVHNGFMDLAFLMTHFVVDAQNGTGNEQLPDTLPECKQLITSHFPLIYDTKILATECSPTYHAENTGLGPLFERICITQNVANRVQVVVHEHDVPDQEHEAAYDAYMTGVCFIGLCEDIEGDGEGGVYEGLWTVPVQGPRYARNKLFQMSLYTMDLDNVQSGSSSSDPLKRGMLAESTFCVTGIDPAVSTRDIVRVLAPLQDEQRRRVMYEIVWVDDTTFMVSASFKQGMMGMIRMDPNGQQPQPQQRTRTAMALQQSEAASRQVIQKHGAIIERALKGRFTHEDIMTLEEYIVLQKKLQKKQQQQEQKQPAKEDHASVFSRLAGWFGFGKRKAAEDENVAEAAEPANKRRRLR